MNTKRQTIWLVSMLSIMVVLSAYYLFTSDTDELQIASNQIETQDIVLESSETSQGDIEQDRDVLFLEDVIASELAKTDKEILEQVQAQQESGLGFFTTLHLERDEALALESERIMANIVDGDSETMAEAYEELVRIEDKEMKLNYMESLLTRDYTNAIITEEDNKWKVIVQTNEMEKSQAVSIIDMVMNEMAAGPNQVVVEIRP